MTATEARLLSFAVLTFPELVAVHLLTPSGFLSCFQGFRSDGSFDVLYLFNVLPEDPELWASFGADVNKGRAEWFTLSAGLEGKGEMKLYTTISRERWEAERRDRQCGSS